MREEPQLPCHAAEWVLAARRHLALLALVLAGSTGLGAGQAIVIGPGETIEARMPAGDPRSAVVSFDLFRTIDGPVTLEASALDFDTRLHVAKLLDDGTTQHVAGDDDGGLGTNSRLVLEAEAGARYRIDVGPAPTDDWGGKFELKLTPGRIEPLGIQDEWRLAGAYWDRVEERTVERGISLRGERAHIGRAAILRERGEYRNAATTATRALNTLERDLGEDDARLAPARIELSRTLLELGAYQEARALAERALATSERAFGSQDPLIATACDQLARLLRLLSERDAAMEMQERALTIRETTFGPEHPAVADSLLSLAGMTFQNSQRARSLRERALAIYDKAYAPDHPFAGVLVFGKARAGKERALAIREEALGPEHPLVADSLDRLAWSLIAENEYEAARLLLERAAAILERALGPEHPKLVRVLTSLAWPVLNLGEYERARALYDRALAICEKTYGPEGRCVAAVLIYKGYLLEVMGDYEGARPLFERTLAIRESTCPPEQPCAYNARYHLGRLYYLIGDLARAEPLLEQSLAIRKAIFGTDNIGLAFVFNYLGLVRHAQGRYAESRDILERALDLLELHYGPDHDETGYTLYYLAALLRDAGQASEARKLLERAIAIAEREAGAVLPLLAERLSLLARLELDLGNTQSAVDAALRAEAVGIRHLDDTVRTLSERAALRYSAVRGKGTDVALTVLGSRALDDPELRRRVWQAAINSRAVVLEEIASRQRRAVAAAPAARTLARAREELAALMVRGAGQEPAAVHEARLLRARQEKEQAEEALARATQGYRVAAGVTDLDAVREGLPHDAALVAFVRYERVQRIEQLSRERREEDAPRPVPSYAAFVLVHGEQTPSMVALGPAEAIDRAVIAWSREASHGLLVEGRSPGRATDAYYQAAVALRRLVWDPVVAHVADAEQVFVVPDGALHLVNFYALPKEDGSFLVESRARVHYLSAERDLAAPRRAIVGMRSLLVLGNPSFDDAAPFAALAPPPRVERLADAPGSSSATGSEAVLIASSRPFRGERADCPDFRSLRFEPLPGSGDEADAIVRLWRERQAPETVLHLTGAAAHETAFKSLAPEHALLHVATHGFFLGGECVRGGARTRGIGRVEALEPAPGESAANEGWGEAVPSQAPSRVLPGPAGENPLRISGLALAGANHREHVGPDEDDGILTAEEIATLDLSGVEWTVLSACNTGVGDIAAGEGVFGLRRAFRIAGVGTLIMSLWPVDDESTRQWMTALYDARLNGSLSTAQAVREASLQVLRARRQANELDHPFYWAAFVAAGDWR